MRVDEVPAKSIWGAEGWNELFGQKLDHLAELLWAQPQEDFPMFLGELDG